jgi:hypothetical protein
VGFAPLVALLFLLGLLASRTGVVLHELAGHFGVARAFGCSLAELRLFLFGGGFVEYRCEELTAGAHLAIELGGIAVQGFVGVALAFVAWRVRGGSVLALALASMAALFVLHALFYLVMGVHYGVGDGRTLHLLLGDARRIPVAAGSALLVALSFGFAAAIGRRLAPLVPGRSAAARTAFAGAAMLAAAALHGGAFLAEQRILADATYAATFVPQPAIEMEQALRRFEREAPRAPEEVAAQRRVLAQRHTPFPLRPALGAGMAVAAIGGLAAGLRRADRAAPVALGRALLRVAWICALAQAVIVALDRAF